MSTLRTLCGRHTCARSELDEMQPPHDEKDAYEWKALAVRGDRLASLRSQIAPEEQLLDGLSIQGSHACEDASM
eukprot:2890762-Amphidinium_carterae.1